MMNRSTTVLALILALVFAVYAPSLVNGFAMDDRLVAMGTMDAGKTNHMLIELRGVGDYFSSHYWAGSQPAGDLFRPVTIYSYALRHHFFGDFPFPAHLANILLHLLAVALGFWMLRRLRFGLFATSLGCATFAFHAIHSEVVSTVVGRAELFAFVFGAAAMAMWMVSRDGPVVRRMSGGVTAGLLLFLAFCSKESAVSWPPFFVVFAAAVYWTEHRNPMSWRRLLSTCGGVAVVSIAPLILFLVLRHHALADVAANAVPTSYLVNQIADLPWMERWPTALGVWGYALVLTVFPFELAADYSTYAFATVENLWDARPLAVVMLFVVLLVAAVRARLHHPALFVAVACFFGFSFLTSNVPIAIGTIFGERLYYTPSLAMAFVVASLWHAARTKVVFERTVLFCLGAWIATCCTVLFHRHPVWKDDASLFLNEVQNQPRSVRMHTTASQVYSDRGARSLAVSHLQEASILDPENALVWNNLAAIYLEAGQLELAASHARRGLAASHIARGEDLFKLHCNLGLIHAAGKQIQPAVEQMQLTLRHRPSFLRAFRELQAWQANGLMPSGKLSTLLDDIEHSLDPQDTRGRMCIQIYRGLLAYRGIGAEEGARMIDAALAAFPPHAVAGWMHRVGVYVVDVGQPAAAVRWFQAALVKAPYRLDTFHELVKMNGAGVLSSEDLAQWVDGRGDAPTWNLYRALLLYQNGIVTRDVAAQKTARVALQAALKDLPRWQHGGRLVAEARMELSNLCRLLGDTEAASRYLQHIVDDSSMPARKRDEARTRLRPE